MRRACLVVLTIALAACSIERGALGGTSPTSPGDGGDTPRDGGSRFDAGDGDAGGTADAGAPADAGGSPDAGTTDAGGPADAGCTSPTTWYRDGDGDGFGDATTASTGCAPPSGGTWVTASGDCDDGSGTTFPGAAEPCNAVDDDCSGLVDDGDSCPCPMRRRSGHPYLFCDTNQTWSGGRSACMDVGYDLVVIADESENAWVWSQASGLSGSGIDWWLGLQRDGSGRFVWVDGSVAWDGGAVGYANFRGSGAPDGSGPCVEMGNDDGGGAWNDVSCSQATHWVCEAP